MGDDPWVEYLITPEPAEGIGEEGAAVFVGVATVAEVEAVVVFGEFEGGGHLLVGEGPVAVGVVEVVGAVLEEDAEGFFSVLRMRAG